MQTLQSVLRIEDTERKDNLLEIVSDEYCRIILKSIIHKPKSATEISADEKIPISTAYRRLQTLHDNHLVSISGILTDDGKKTFLYKTKIKGIQGKYEDGKVEVKVIYNN